MKKLLGIIVLGLLGCNFVNAAELSSKYDGAYITGKLLIAMPHMPDDRFKNTVIIMLENNEKGAWGIVINKPLTLIPLGSLINKPRDATNKQKELYNVKIPVYWGGPVNENNILILHSHEYKNETTTNYKNISISSDYNILFDIADNKGPKKNLVIVGISSWGEGHPK